MKDCVFCQIAGGMIPAKKLFENEDVIAFEDLNPVAPVHLLVVPKQHFENLYQMTSSEEGLDALTRLHRALPAIARACGLEDQGFRLINNCGKHAGQTVMHVHFHLIGGLELGPSII